MKNFKSCLTLFLLITLIISCSSDDDGVTTVDFDNGITVTNLTLSKQTVFVNEVINLDFESEGHESIAIAAEESDIAITTLSETSYEITSSTAVSGFIDVTLARDTISELQQVWVDFIDRGTTDYQTIDGITIDASNFHRLELILGEPEEIVSRTLPLINEDNPDADIKYIEYESWYYFSKGISFVVAKIAKTVESATIYGEPWTVLIDGETKQGVPYAYDIGTLGNFTDINGILMDDVVAELDAPAEEDKFPGTSTQIYVYPNAAFAFSSNNIEDYEGKKVSSIILY